jgi:hypothetical protein
MLRVEKACLLIDLLAGTGCTRAVLIGRAVDRKRQARDENRRIAGGPGCRLCHIMGQGLAEELEELVHPIAVRDVLGALGHHRIADGARRGKDGSGSCSGGPWRLSRHQANAVDIAVRGHPHEDAVMRPAIVGVIIVAVIVMTIGVSRG